MAVVTADEHASPVRDVVDQLPRRQLRRRPALVVPLPAENPLSRLRLRALADPTRKLRGRVGILQAHVIERGAAVDHVYVGVVEPGQHPPPFGVNHRGARPAPALDLVSRADIDDAIAKNRDRLRGGLSRIPGPHQRVRDDEIGGRTCGWRAGGCERRPERD